MFCSKCGAKLEEGVRFCPGCGTPVENIEDSSKQETVNVVEKKPESKKNSVEKAEKEAATKNGTGNMLSMFIIGGICVAILAILIVVGAFVVAPMFDDGSKQLVYLDDGDIYYLKDMNKPDKAIKVDETEYSYLNAWFSEDGKYLYYYGDNEKKTIYRIAVSKIKANSKKPGKYVEKIGKNIGWPTFIDDKKFLYIEDDSLILNDKGEEDTIAKDVNEFTLSKDKGTVYYLVEDGETEFCYTDLSSMKEEKIDNISYMCGNGLVSNGTYFFYLKDYDDEKACGDLYSVNGKGKPQMIDEDVSSVRTVNNETGKVYYYKANEVTKPYLDYIEDSEAQSDATATKPQVKDFLTETNESTVMKACLSKEDYKYYTEDDNKEYFYHYLYEDEDAGMYYIYSNDSETWYYCDYNENKKDGYKKAKWYVYDQESAEKAWENYNLVEERVEEREWLKEEKYTYFSYDLYAGTDSKNKQLICEGVDHSSVHISAKYDVVFYGKENTDVEKVPINKLFEDDFSIYDYIKDNVGVSDGTCYYSIAGKETLLDLEGGIKKLKVGADNKIAFVTKKSDNTLYCATVSGDKLGEIKKVDELDAAGAYTWVGSDLYYYSKLKESKSKLSVYRNGKSEEVADGLEEYVYVTKDGVVINLDGSLNLISGGKEKKIDRKVDNYNYINEKCILYVKKGDLYLYNGSEESIRIARDVGYNYISYAASNGKKDKTYYVGR